MSAAIQMRREPLTTDEQQHVWQALCEDETLAGIAYKIETDAWGRRTHESDANPAFAEGAARGAPARRKARRRGAH